MQICSASNFICHLLINSLLHVSCLPGSITALSLYHCSLIAVDGIITRTGYSPTTSLIYRKAAFLNLANVLLRVTVILVKVAAAVAVAAAAVVTVITALSLGTCISTERLVVLSSGTVLQLCHSSPSLSSRHIRAVGTVSLMQWGGTNWLSELLELFLLPFKWVYTPNVRPTPVMGVVWTVCVILFTVQSAFPPSPLPPDLGHYHSHGPMLLCPPSHWRVHHGVNHTPYKTLCYSLHNPPHKWVLGFG